jgi:hypothetical protein
MWQRKGVTYSIFLRSSHFLDGESIVEQSMTREVLDNILLDNLNAKIGIVDTLNLVSNTRDYR